MVKLLLVGYGAWGKRIAQSLDSFDPADVQLKIGARNDWQDIVNDWKPDGCIIATPPDSHVLIARYCLEKNIPCLIEKPLGLSLAEVEPLLRYDVPVLVDHIYLYSDVFKAINLLNGSKFENIYVEMTGNGPVRNYSSLWDYGPHAIAIVLALTRRYPDSVSLMENKSDNIFNTSLYTISLKYSEFTATCLVGNGDVRSNRTIRINNDGLEIYYNDLERPEYHNPPLMNVLREFINITDKRSKIKEINPIYGLKFAVSVISILETLASQIRYIA